MTISSDDIADLGTIVGLWAHPDDEAWFSAGLMAAGVQNGQSVSCITATCGEAGQFDPNRWSSESLGGSRRAELHNALAAIGVTRSNILDLSDGGLEEIDYNQIVPTLGPLIDQSRPDTILTFEPEGITGHTDHKTVSKWAVEHAKRASYQIRVLGAVESRENYERISQDFHDKFNIYFNTGRPVLINQDDADLCFRIPPDLVKRKIEAIKAHASQTAQMFEYEGGPELIRLNAATECFISLWPK